MASRRRPNAPQRASPSAPPCGWRRATGRACPAPPSPTAGAAPTTTPCASSWCSAASSAPGPPAGDELAVVVLSDRTHTCGVAVDRFLGEHDLVVRPLDRRLGKVADLSATAIMADGLPIVIVDVEDMVRSVVRMVSSVPASQ